MQANGKHLLSIINDLLDLAKIESGNVELELEPVDCREVLEEIVTALRPLADEKGIDARDDRAGRRRDGADRPPLAEPDPDQLHQQRDQVHGRWEASESSSSGRTRTAAR